MDDLKELLRALRQAGWTCERGGRHWFEVDTGPWPELGVA